MQIVCCPIETLGEKERRVCVESIEGMQRVKGEFGPAMQPVPCIYCFMRNQRLRGS
jgi:hypothetical protein